MMNILIKNKIPVLIFSTAILILAGFGFPKEALAETSGWFKSTNLLRGVFPEPTSIVSFVYNLSAKPPDTEATVQFSQDDIEWYNSSRELNGTDILNIGEDNEIDLSGLIWSGANFYYKITFTYYGTDTPVLTPILEQITVNYTKEETAGCGTPVPNYGIPCGDHASAWTYCKCKPERLEGYRISPEFNLSGETGETVKDSRIFWQAEERVDGTIKVEVRVSYDGGNNWSDWQPIVNGGRIPGLEPGTNLYGATIQTKTSFVGGPDFYPSLENIKIFIELE